MVSTGYSRIYGITVSPNDEITFSEDFNPEYINSRGNTPLISACLQALVSNRPDVALAIMNTYKEKCLPDYVNRSSETALMWMCCIEDPKFVKAPLRMLELFGERCLPEQIDRSRDTALLCASYYNITPVILEMLNRFGVKCQILQYNLSKGSVIENAIAKKNVTVLQKISEIFKIDYVSHLRMESDLLEIEKERKALTEKIASLNSVVVQIKNKLTSDKKETLRIFEIKSKVESISDDPKVVEKVRSVFDILLA